MFGHLMEQLQAAASRAANPFQGFLGELWAIWSQDVARAVLLARWHWQRLPAGLVQQAAGIQQQAQAAQAASQIDAQVRTQLGMLGIFPGSGGGPSFGAAMDPGQAMFIIAMAQVQANQGDPPIPGGMGELAERVFRGQMDPVDALIASVPPLARPQLAAAAQMLNMLGMPQFLRIQAVIQAASCLPRERILDVCPEVNQR